MTTISPVNHDANARAYFLSLQSGLKPSVRPEIGEFWQESIEVLERAYERAHGDTTAMQRALSALSKQNPALADLLAPTTPLQGKSTQVEEVAESNELGMPALPEAARLAKGLSRGACPELDVYIEYSKHASAEAYEDFHVVCGLWLFSVIAGRRAYLQIKQKRFYTNLMLAMCADSSMFAKSFTARAAKNVLYATDLVYKLGPNRISPQKLLSDMAGMFVPTNYEELPIDKQNKIVRRLGTPGQKGFYFDEFGKFVQNMLRKGSTMADFVDLFLEFDECPPEYENATISRSSEPISQPYLAVLGSMTPPNLKENARSGADFWTDGFWARFSFIVAPPPTPDMLPENITDDDDDDDSDLIPARLVQSLKDWHERLGVPACTIDPVLDAKKQTPTGKYVINREDLKEVPCTISREARRAWKQYRLSLKRLCLTFPHKDFHGSYTRLPETAMRIAVLLASLSNNNRIEMRHWARAQELAETLRKNLHELYSQVNTPVSTESQASKIEDEIIKHMNKYPTGITINVLRTSYMKNYSSKQLEEVLEAMKRSGAVEEFKTNHAKKYKLRKEQIND